MTTLFWFLMFLGVTVGVLMWRSKYRLYAVPTALVFVAPPLAAVAWLFLAYG